MSLGYQALRSGAAWLDLSARGRIVARGRDRARLLHAITTNEVKKMTPGIGCYAFLLNPQGHGEDVSSTTATPSSAARPSAVHQMSPPRLACADRRRPCRRRCPHLRSAPTA